MGKLIADGIEHRACLVYCQSLFMLRMFWWNIPPIIFVRRLFSPLFKLKVARSCQLFNNIFVQPLFESDVQASGSRSDHGRTASPLHRRESPAPAANA
jgi:hypothetical protein